MADKPIKQDASEEPEAVTYDNIDNIILNLHDRIEALEAKADGKEILLEEFKEHRRYLRKTHRAILFVLFGASLALFVLSYGFIFYDLFWGKDYFSKLDRWAQAGIAAGPFVFSTLSAIFALTSIFPHRPQLLSSRWGKDLSNMDQQTH